MQKRKGDESRAHLLFWLRSSGLGAFRRCATADLVQGNPQSLIVPFRLHQVSEAFRRCAPLLWAFPQIIKQKQINIQLFLQLMKSTVLYSLRILQALVCCSIYTV